MKNLRPWIEVGLGVLLFLCLLALLAPPVTADAEPKSKQIACEVMESDQLHIRPCTIINENLARLGVQ